MKRAFFLSLLVGASALIGCSTANKFVGTWETQITQFGQTGSMTQTIKPDGTFDGNLALKTPIGDVTVKVDGTWTSPDEKTLTLTQKNITMTGLPKELEAQSKSQLEANKDKPQTMTITWNGPDEFTTSSGQGQPPLTFKRKK